MLPKASLILLLIFSSLQLSAGIPAGISAGISPINIQVGSKDDVRQAAEKLEAEAERLQSEGKKESLLAATAKYEKAAALRLSIEDRAGAWRAESGAGVCHYLLDDYRNAEASFLRALGLGRELKDAAKEADSLNNLGVIYSELGEPEKTLRHYEEALRIWEGLPASSPDVQKGLIETLNNLGTYYHQMRQLDRALAYYNRVLPLIRSYSQRTDEMEATLLSNLGQLHGDMGEHAEGLEHLRASLLLYERMADKRQIAGTLNLLGRAYEAIGDLLLARTYLERALALRREVKDTRGMATTLNNLGVVLHGLGDLALAREHYRESLALREQRRDRSGQAVVHNNLALLMVDEGNFTAARESLQKALAIHREDGDRWREGIVLHNLGWLAGRMGEREREAESYNAALAIEEEVDNTLGAALTRAALARIDARRGDLTAARAKIESALDYFDSVRARLVGPSLRSSYLGLRRGDYESYIEILMQLHERDPRAGHDRAAFLGSERARSRSFIDYLAETRAEIRRGAPAHLVAEERALQQQLNAAESERWRLLGGKYDAKALREHGRRIDELIVKYRELQQRIRLESPRYAALTYPDAIESSAVERALDPGTVLLAYHLGEKRSYLWAVTATGWNSFILPGRARIESLSRAFYEQLLSSQQRARRFAAERRATELGRLLLGPASDLIRGKRLAIIADGALHYIPFAALGDPGASGYRPLVADHEVAHLPSMTFLIALRGGEGSERRKGEGIAVVADPVFEPDDPRVKSVKAPRPQSQAARDERAGPRLERLPLTRAEAEVIAEVAGGRQLSLALDFEASRERFAELLRDRFSIIHFGTHGLLNTEHPELSGLAFSMLDERGAARDGFLRAHEIYALRLDAELVVLSACQTALGKEVRGEGLVGLASGFMYAGARNVVASLWNVRDAATSHLMREFYRGLLQQRLTPQAALRAAQNSMRQNPRWSAPYYWAGFTVQGDWGEKRR